jgi:Ran GTPase-activating protein (RanGAP) involved in mRNA processing and transport
LGVNGHIRTLDLSHAEIGDEGLKCLAQSLYHNRHTNALYLDHNVFGDEGAIALANALRCNIGIKILGIHSNDIGPSGIQAIAESLKYNHTLRSLYLHDNDDASSSSTVTALVEALRYNHSIRSIVWTTSCYPSKANDSEKLLEKMICANREGTTEAKRIKATMNIAPSEPVQEPELVPAKTSSHPS